MREETACMRLPPFVKLDAQGKILYDTGQTDCMNGERGESMDHAQIERINELARKKKTVGLTAQELEEQAALRAQYLKEFRANMEDTLSRVRVEQADGTYKPLVKKDKKN